jgi:geranylgeranyl pyrophosphate synthase
MIAHEAALLAGDDVRVFMEEIEARLTEASAWAGGTTARTGGATLAAGGKRLRPLLVFLSAPASRRRLDGLVRAAAAIELVHMATLVHDDVLDRAALRRGQPTVWSTDGDSIAAATGDYLFARAFGVLVETGDMPAIDLLARCAVALSQGEALQTLQTRRPETTPEEYLERCTLKTGQLFAASCALGARLGGLEDADVDELATFGRCLGLAFQVADDVLDCGGTTASTGKPIGTDLLAGVATLPLLIAARQDADVRAAIATPPDPADLLPLLQRVASTGALAEARETALDFVRLAESALDRVGGELDTRPLRAVVKSVVDRDT